MHHGSLVQCNTQCDLRLPSAPNSGARSQARLHCCRKADYAAFAGLPATMIDALSTLALFGMDGEVQE